MNTSKKIHFPIIIHALYDITKSELQGVGKVLTKHIPQHENKAQPNHHPQDDCISPLSEVDFVHQVVDHWKFVCQVVQLGLDSLKRINALND